VRDIAPQLRELGCELVPVPKAYMLGGQDPAYDIKRLLVLQDKMLAYDMKLVIVIKSTNRND